MTQANERSNIIFNLTVDATSQFQLCQSFISIDVCMSYGHSYFVFNGKRAVFYEWKCFFITLSLIRNGRKVHNAHPHTHTILWTVANYNCLAHANVNQLNQFKPMARLISFTHFHTHTRTQDARPYPNEFYRTSRSILYYCALARSITVQNCTYAPFNPSNTRNKWPNCSLNNKIRIINLGEGGHRDS